MFRHFPDYFVPLRTRCPSYVLHDVAISKKNVNLSRLMGTVSTEPFNLGLKEKNMASFLWTFNKSPISYLHSQPPRKNSRLVAGEPLPWNIYSSKLVYVHVYIFRKFPECNHGCFSFCASQNRRTKIRKAHPSGWWRMGFPIFPEREYAYCTIWPRTRKPPLEKGQESGIRTNIYACTCIYCNITLTIPQKINLQFF